MECSIDFTIFVKELLAQYKSGHITKHKDDGYYQYLLHNYSEATQRYVMIGFDWDHKEPISKWMNISAVRNKYDWQRKREKCQLLCAPDHVWKTWSRGEYLPEGYVHAKNPEKRLTRARY